MENQTGEYMSRSNDYFAEALLGKLDSTDPVFAAYEAQDISRDVGFDFANFQDVVPRALDEIRETKEAYEEGQEGREHFGDEIADIMFSLVNLARHAGIKEMPSMETFTGSIDERATGSVDSLAAIDLIGQKISDIVKAETEEDFLAQMDRFFHSAMSDTVLLAVAEGFNPEELFLENVRKYLIRCRAIEQLAAEDGKQWSDLSANNEIITYWKKAKLLLK